MLSCFAELKRKAQARTGRCLPIIVIQEAGLDGFWIHRVLQAEGIESHVVDPASIATSRRRRRAKTDKLDGEALLRALLAYKRGEPAGLRDASGADAGGGRRPRAAMVFYNSPAPIAQMLVQPHSARMPFVIDRLSVQNPLGQRFFQLIEKAITVRSRSDRNG